MKVLPEFESAECGLENKPDQRLRYPGAFSSNEPTPYERSGHATSAEAQSAKEHPNALHNAREPYYLIQHEKAVHRMMAYLSVRGDSLREIAEATGYTSVAISNILRQPHCQALIAEETKRLGTQEVTVVLRGKAMAAVQRLSKELDNENTGSSQSRIAAANAILDRVYGKPNQPITHHDGASLDELTDEEIAKRLEDLKLQKSN